MRPHPHVARHATVALIRQLRAAGAKRGRRVGRIPRPIPPTAIERAYHDAIVAHVNEAARRCVQDVSGEVLRDLVRLRQRQGRADAALPPSGGEFVDLPAGVGSLRLGRAVRPLVERVMEYAGRSRSVRVVERPDLGAEVGNGVRGAFAAYDLERDAILLGALPLGMLRGVISRGRVETDGDVLAVKVLVHEALHAAARGRAGTGATPAETVALRAVEEGTAELAAQLLAPHFLGEVGPVGETARRRAAAPLIRWERDDVRLTRPTSYPTACTRLARLAVLAGAPSLLGWAMDLRGLRGGERLDALAGSLGRDAVVAYLARPLGEADGFDALIETPQAVTLPPWVATGAPEPGEVDAATIGLIRHAEAIILSPDLGERQVLAAIDVVDLLGDARASLHARTALQQRVNLQGPPAPRADDAGSEQAGRHAVSLIARAAQRFADEFRPHEVHAVARRFGKRLDAHAQAQLDAQVRSALGVPLSALERPVRDQLEGWAAVNVNLIRTIPPRYFDRLRADIEEAFESGTHPSTLAEDIADDYDISINDARRIARDQLGKLNADVTRERHEALGVTRYTWRTMRDNRVRSNHSHLEGEIFSYDDPPLGGGTTAHERGHPGTGIQCRCYQEPHLQDIIDGVSG